MLIVSLIAHTGGAQGDFALSAHHDWFIQVTDRAHVAGTHANAG